MSIITPVICRTSLSNVGSSDGLGKSETYKPLNAGILIKSMQSVNHLLCPWILTNNRIKNVPNLTFIM